MARVKSEDKRQALLEAAVDIIASQGLAATTAKIARQAGVAEGTLFTYFKSKDELYNQLYLSLKAELYQAMMLSYPAHDDLKAQVQYVWNAYTQWGVDAVKKRKAMKLLMMSPHINEQTRAQGAEMFGQLNHLLQRMDEAGVLYECPCEFIPAFMNAVAEMTMDLMSQHPRQALHYATAGFNAFWRGICKKD